MKYFVNQFSLLFPVSGGPVVLLLSDVQWQLREVQHLPGLPTYPEGGGRESLYSHHCVSLTMSIYCYLNDKLIVMFRQGCERIFL